MKMSITFFQHKLLSNAIPSLNFALNFCCRLFYNIYIMVLIFCYGHWPTCRHVLHFTSEVVVEVLVSKGLYRFFAALRLSKTVPIGCSAMLELGLSLKTLIIIKKNTQ